ncbi:hypothetical protein E3N88_07164 [Mikania micrantha]|uniref:Uncharacterized protein n=1 Tax=Mikania micrantha TaxID=192012 RepID=A0A5N6PQT9_9ASTR|nr:hypothetical protein E3N88_07164 [Mikania micrantha]
MRIQENERKMKAMGTTNIAKSLKSKKESQKIQKTAVRPHFIPPMYMNRVVNQVKLRQDRGSNVPQKAPLTKDNKGEKRKLVLVDEYDDDDDESFQVNGDLVHDDHVEDNQVSENQVHQTSDMRGAPKKVRGYSTKAQTWKMDSTQRIHVRLNKFGKPVGDEANELVQFLGTLVRMSEHVSIEYPNWRKVPIQNKEDMYSLVKVLLYDPSLTVDEIVAQQVKNDKRVSQTQFKELATRWFTPKFQGKKGDWVIDFSNLVDIAVSRVSQVNLRNLFEKTLTKDMASDEQQCKASKLNDLIEELLKPSMKTMVIFSVTCDPIVSSTATATLVQGIHTPLKGSSTVSRKDKDDEAGQNGVYVMKHVESADSKKESSNAGYTTSHHVEDQYHHHHKGGLENNTKDLVTFQGASQDGPGRGSPVPSQEPPVDTIIATVIRRYVHQLGG